LGEGAGPQRSVLPESVCLDRELEKDIRVTDRDLRLPRYKTKDLRLEKTESHGQRLQTATIYKCALSYCSSY
jgi:hypothetical protein